MTVHTRARPAILVTIAAAGHAVAAPSPVFGPTGPGAQGPAAHVPFTVVGLPDTQFYSESFPQIFANQTQWVVDNQKANNIAFVSHYGDLVQHGDDLQEWNNAKTAMQTLYDSDIPFGVVAGNHDVTANGTSGQPYIPQNYLQNFGPQTFAGRDYFGGASPSGMSSYQTFNGGGRDFLALHLAVDTPIDELKWAQEVVAANRDKPVMVTTHRYLQDIEDYIPDGLEGITDLVVESGRYPDIWYAVEGTYHPDGIHTEQFFRDFVQTNENIFMVQAGHFHEEFRQSSQNLSGLTVHEILADYQDDPNGGNGWLRLMEFDVSNNKIDVDSYSSYLDQFRSADESKFSLDVDFKKHAPKNPTLVFQNGFNGYDGAQDTWINEDSKNTSYGASGLLTVDDDTTNSLFDDDQGQGLIRFDDIFSVGPETGKIPFNSTIIEADLRIVVEDDVDFLFDADFDVYMMTAPWDESSTWNSLGDGAEDDAGIYLGQFEGDNDPNGDAWRQLDVTAALQMWADGIIANYGFLILPEIISGNDDGIDIWTSEAGNFLYHPALEVEFWHPGLVPAPGAALAFLTLGAGAMTRRTRPKK